ncbi:MAG: threonine aldolase [Spirochaetaceae bacterium]|jgi:threonine aldolase|nr:threonine aldolase [Spirochaetaceae bacterium]
MIDIRSDTVTLPTEEMRAAMAQAEVGDDVYGDDPTVNRLERLGAELVGKEAAVFVPSGTFGNQLALFTWCPRGSEVILPEACHIVQHEAGAASVIAGVQLRTIPSPDGVPGADAFHARVRKRDLHAPATSLISYENATSFGRTVSRAEMEAVKNTARAAGVPVHLDGARIFNAALALGVDAPALAAHADSVMFCLSKGLCAPVGSLLAGPAEFVAEARMKRKIMGGGMRQAGVLAAAGLVALESCLTRLAEDHRQAKQLAAGLAEIPGVSVDRKKVEINMVFFDWPPAKDTARAEAAVAAFLDRGIRINMSDLGRFRFVTHYGTGGAEIEAILNAAREVFHP